MPGAIWDILTLDGDEILEQVAAAVIWMDTYYSIKIGGHSFSIVDFGLAELLVDQIFNLLKPAFDHIVVDGKGGEDE